MNIYTAGPLGFSEAGRAFHEDRVLAEIRRLGHDALDPWTLTEASKIYRKCLNPLVAYGSPGSEIPAGDAITTPSGGGGDAPPADLLSTPVAELTLSVRAGNCLEAENIDTIGDLVQKSEEELLQLRNFGRTSLTEVKEKLAELGLRLKGDDGSSADAEPEPINPETTATA